MRSAIWIVAAGLLIIAYAARAQENIAEHPSTGDQQSHSKHAGTMMSGDMQKDMQMMNKMMVAKLGQSDAQYDARFIDLMIPHHEGAVLMAKDALKNAKHQELRDMAAKMIKDQQKEIEQLKQWRRAWYSDASGPSETKRLESR